MPAPPSHSGGNSNRNRKSPSHSSHASHTHHRPRLRLWARLACLSGLGLAAAAVPPLSLVSALIRPAITVAPAVDPALLTASLLVDTRTQFAHPTERARNPDDWQLRRRAGVLDSHRRDAAGPDQASSTATATTFAPASSSSSDSCSVYTTPSASTFKTASLSRSSAPSIAPVVIASPQPLPDPLPLPFDTSMANNFTAGDTSCPQFLNSMLLDPTFKACYPFSMLVETSTALFDAAKSLPQLNHVLDVSCAVNASACDTFLQTLAVNLTAPQNCANELALGQPVVTEAYYGLRAYRPVYAAACLRDPADAAYCYADAMTNTTLSDNAYLYFLPYSLSLPTSARPACSWCVRQIMDVFRLAAADRSQLVADTYAPAAQQIDGLCGPAFLNTTLPTVYDSAGPGPATMTASLVWTCVVAFWLAICFLAA